MSNSSNDAFFNSENKARRMTHKEVVFGSLMEYPKTIREVSRNTALTYNQVQKRVDDLINEGRIKPDGEKIEGGNNNSIFKVNMEPQICFKKLPLSRWLKKEHPEILYKYESLINHKI